MTVGIRTNQRQDSRSSTIDKSKGYDAGEYCNKEYLRRSPKSLISCKPLYKYALNLRWFAVVWL